MTALTKKRIDGTERMVNVEARLARVAGYTDRHEMLCDTESSTIAVLLPTAAAEKIAGIAELTARQARAAKIATDAGWIFIVASSKIEGTIYSVDTGDCETSRSFNDIDKVLSWLEEQAMNEIQSMHECSPG